MLMLEDIVLNKQPTPSIQQQSHNINTATTKTTSKSNKRSYSAANLDDLISEPEILNSNTAFKDELQDQAMDALSNLYESLLEEDMWSGLWQRKAKLKETLMGIAYEQMVIIITFLFIYSFLN